MSDLELLLREDLARVADAAPVPLLPDGPAYRARRATVRRLPAAWLATVATAAVAALVIALVVTMTGGATGIPPANGGPQTWPARGNLAGAPVAVAAVRTWDAEPLPKAELPHHDVRVLYAQRTPGGDVVVLWGVDALGHARVALLGTDVTDHTAYRHRLHLLADVLAPTGDRVGLITFDEERPTPRPTHDRILVAVAAPGTGSLQWQDGRGRWRPFTAAVDGAGALFYGLPQPPANGSVSAVDAPNGCVRAGDSGDGVQPLDVQKMDVDVLHDVDPEEETNRPNPNESCSTGPTGGVCSLSRGLSAGGPDDGGGSDLRTGNRNVGSNAAAQWMEFFPEANLMAESLHAPDGGYGSAAILAELLPDGTGLFLQNFSGDGGTSRLILYIDRPEWYAGRLGADLPATAPIPAVGTVVPHRPGAELVVIAADGVRVQWDIGNGWHDVPVQHHVADAVEHAGETGALSAIHWRAVDAAGRVVAHG